MKGRGAPGRRRPFLAALAGSVSSLAVPEVTAGTAGAAPETPPYETGLLCWGPWSEGFGAWELDGVRREADGSLVLDPERARRAFDPYPPGGYRGGDYFNGGAHLTGQATSPATPGAFPFHQVIPSWNAVAPPGTWLECLVRARVPLPGGSAGGEGDEGGERSEGGRWTRWYSLGVWAAAGPVARHSVAGQRDADGAVAVDTLELDGGRPGATALQLRLRLCSVVDGGVDGQLEGEAPGGAGPGPVQVTQVAAALSGPPPAVPVAPVVPAGDPSRWGRVLDLPACSQMVYPDGGEAWCSPTSVAMVLGYWQGEGPGGGGACAERVRGAVEGVYDRVYRGHGNWPFNTAYAATQGMGAFVARLPGFAVAEAWIAAGIPLVISYGWGRGELAGAPLPASNGHLAVLAGFDAAGDPVVYDPAAPRDAAVRRTYPRRQLEALWLSHSGGAAYVIAPQNRMPAGPLP